MKFSVKPDFERAERALSDFQVRQLPFAAAAALTDTAKEAKRAVTDHLPSIFDKPTPFTLNAIGAKPATKSHLESVVFVKDIQGKYLLLEEMGGERTAADNTRKPGSPFSVPGKALQLNQFGNIPNGLIAKLGDAATGATYSWDYAKQPAGTFGRKGLAEAANKKADRRRRSLARRSAKAAGAIAYFKGQGPNDRGPGGFFVRLPGHKITRLTSFETKASYQPIFHFRDRVALVAKQTFRVFLMKRLREAMKTAK
jgi:hypothetical protein